MPPRTNAHLLLASLLVATLTVGLAPPATAAPCSLPGGYDLLLTDPTLTHFDLGQGQLSIPNYGGPLDMHFQGVPIGTYSFQTGTFDVGPTDTIIRRSPADTIASIEMERLFLQSVEAPDIFVTLQSDRGLNAGDPEPGPASTGTLTLSYDTTCATGTLDSSLNVLFDVRQGAINGPILGSSGSLAIPHATLKSVGTSWTTTPAILQDFTEQASQTNEAHHVRCPSVVIPGINDGFCPGNPRAVSCSAEALRIQVRQGGVTKLDVPIAQSALWGPAVAGAYALPPGPAPRAPPAPMYHDEAGVIAVSPTVAGVTVQARGLHSRCDATARLPGGGTFADVYGQAGVEELAITAAGNTILLEAGDFKEQAFGNPAATSARWACNSATVGVNPPPYNPKLCNLGAPGLPPTVTVVAGETTAPVLVQGEWVYTGSNHHVTVTVGPLEVHVYVGKVRIGVVGGPATAATQCLACP
ncbi:MAG: hypothetical protein QOD77_1568 [Thermoplasmata archaeon]|jgi:hypothetical protein|nr:hypothetical protein [Thermoplasmata archaeon]